VTAQNGGGKVGAIGTSNTVAIQDQTIPGKINPTATVINDTDPGSITFNWSSPGGGSAVTDNMEYVYSIDGAGGVATTSTSASRGGLSAGSHSISVYARNNAGNGQAGSASAIIKAKPTPPQVVLKKGPYATCQGGGGCYRYDVTLQNFGGGGHAIDFYCLSPFGSATFSGNTYISNKFCGYADTYATVDGIESNHVDFRP